MLTRCLSCYRAFPPNDTLERLPIGRRVACDPARGRLWVICDACAAWTLQPIEERWEANEDIERRVGTARLLGSTENVSLLRVGDIEILRVGRAGLREEAWWRYGEELLARRSRARKLVTRGKWIERAIGLALVGLPMAGFNYEQRWIDGSRRRVFGRQAWPLPLVCRHCGRERSDLRFHESDVFLQDATPGAPVVIVPCRHCGASAGARVTGIAAEQLLRRSLAWRNHAGGSESLVSTALSQVEQAPSIEAFVRRFEGQPLALRGNAVPGSLALEIALNAGTERRQLDQELAALEARWKEEEELAAIIDRELTR